MSTITKLASKKEWLVIVPDFKDSLARRLEVRQYDVTLFPFTELIDCQRRVDVALVVECSLGRSWM